MRVVFLWHMHQPEYRVDGVFLRPWVQLHALAGYSDMAQALEAAPGMRAVVNFSPVLLDQIDDLAHRLARWRADGRPPGEMLLDALVELPPPGPARAAVAHACRPERETRRTRSSARLAAALAAVAGRDPATLPDGALEELLVAFHASWIGPALLASRPEAAALAQPGGPRGAAARRALLGLLADVMAGLLPRWAALAADGRVELSYSPCYHPLAPLLLDFASAHERSPGVPLPAGRYPGGEARLDWQLQEGARRFESLLGRRPAGCWPAEAAVSAATLAHFARAGAGWIASAQSVLAATLAAQGAPPAGPFRLYRDGATGLCCAFRDDGLSDRIGFAYQHWPPQEAAADLVSGLERLALDPANELVLIALDGENAWEHYPDRGTEFLALLYAALAGHARLRPATMSDCVREFAQDAAALPPLCAGSWVHGELLTWVGHPEKNRAWEILVEAKRRADAAGRDDEKLRHLLGACEGSDWFWWPGAENPDASVAQFDELFRAQLAALYRALGAAPPAALAAPFASGGASYVAAGGTMRPGT